MKPWRLAHLFHACEVAAAFAALHLHADALYAEEAANPLARFAHRRRGEHGYRRDHIEMPLQHLHDSTIAYRQLPSEVRRVCAGLHSAAREYVEAAFREPCVLPAARVDALRDLGKKSVVRILRYPAGSGCRPHVDPGLCTALLIGSAGGLEVNTTDAVPVSLANRPGDYTQHMETNWCLVRQGSLCERGNVLDVLPHWEPVVATDAGDAVVMFGNMMGVLSDGALPGVLHRVRRDWDENGPAHATAAAAAAAPLLSADDSRPPVGTTSAGDLAAKTSLVHCCGSDCGHTAYRFNIVVELRPAQAKRWYAATRTTSSAASRR